VWWLLALEVCGMLLLLLMGEMCGLLPYGQAVLCAFDEHKDADEVVELVKKEGRKCLKFSGDVSKPEVRLVLHGPMVSRYNYSMVVGMWCLLALEVCGMFVACPLE
jgi:hypothetical protein